MRKIILSIKLRPINFYLMIFVSFFYFINNNVFKIYTKGIVQKFFVCYFNDLICPLFFISYSNILLISVNKEIRKLKCILLYGLLSGLVWEFFAPILKKSSVSDINDIFFYSFGSLLYWAITNKNIQRRNLL